MILRHEVCGWYVPRYAIHIILTVLLVVPFAATSEAVTLVMNGPQTAREGDLIEYRLKVVNDDTVNVAGLQVLDTLPAAVDFVESELTPGGIYDPASGLWTLPVLGTGEDDKAARLKLRALVHQNLVTDPAEVVDMVNRAGIVAPPAAVPVKTSFITRIVCAFCIDWEIVSVELDGDHRIDGTWGPFETRYFLYVQVANNGPVMSDATVNATHFDISGGGYGTVDLKPALPVAVSLDAGESRTITFSTDWEEGPDSDYTISWRFEISDVALLDPILPNAASGSWSGDVEGGPGGSGGGCTVNESGAMDPVWFFLIILPGILCMRRRVSLNAICSWASMRQWLILRVLVDSD